jgi:hypothetical protein
MKQDDAGLTTVQNREVLSLDAPTGAPLGLHCNYNDLGNFDRLPEKQPVMRPRSSAG